MLELSARSLARYTCWPQSTPCLCSHCGNAGLLVMNLLVASPGNAGAAIGRSAAPLTHAFLPWLLPHSLPNRQPEPKRSPVRRRLLFRLKSQILHTWPWQGLDWAELRDSSRFDPSTTVENRVENPFVPLQGLRVLQVLCNPRCCGRYSPPACARTAR